MDLRGITFSSIRNSTTIRCLCRVDIALEQFSLLQLLEIYWINAMISNLLVRIEGERYFHMPPGALLLIISLALYKHVCISFQPIIECYFFFNTTVNFTLIKKSLVSTRTKLLRDFRISILFYIQLSSVIYCVILQNKKGSVKSLRK